MHRWSFGLFRGLRVHGLGLQCSDPAKMEAPQSLESSRTCLASMAVHLMVPDTSRADTSSWGLEMILPVTQAQSEHVVSSVSSLPLGVQMGHV